MLKKLFTKSEELPKSVFKLRKKFTISCSHRLHNENYTDEENKNVFGKCNNPPSHGHNYDIILHLKSTELNPLNDMIMNFYDIKEVFKTHIDDVYDHKFLNDCPGFENVVPTAERMCEIFFNKLKPHMPELNAVEIFETSGASAIYEEI